METEDNKKSAAEFLQMVTRGEIDAAYEKFVNMSGKHHNAYFAAGFPALIQAMKKNENQFPGKQFKIKNVLASDDLVGVHSHVILKPGELEISAVHILRFKNGKIIEMWDIGQPIPNNNPNKDGMF
jgi:predicted SnoaL-like aldol condensation-catalyzing enzyme